MWPFIKMVATLIRIQEKFPLVAIEISQLSSFQTNFRRNSNKIRFDCLNALSQLNSIRLERVLKIEFRIASN